MFRGFELNTLATDACGWQATLYTPNISFFSFFFFASMHIFRTPLQGTTLISQQYVQICIAGN